MTEPEGLPQRAAAGFTSRKALIVKYTIFSQNIQYGGTRDADGAHEDRWPGLVERITSVEPDVLLLQEADRWHTDARLKARAERELGMRAFVAPSPTTGLHTVAMVKHELRCSRPFEIKYSHLTHHGFGVAVLELPELAVPLTVISAHLHPNSAEAAAQEAQLIASRAYRYGGIGIVGGDINHVPLGDPEPDWGSVQPYNRSSRALRSPDGTLKANRIVGEKLSLADLTDVAAHLADQRSDQSLRAVTARHGGVRVDQFHVTPPLVPAVLDYRRVDPGPYSDHWGIAVDIETDLLAGATASSWK